VDKLVKHFESAYTSINAARAAELKDEYTAMRNAYCGTPLSENCMFDIDLVSKVICELKRGKAAGLDSLTAEHLKNCHPIVITILARLFNLMLLCGHVPVCFGRSFTIPIPKVKDCRTKALTTDDF